jgi:hypothetical protein
VKKKNLFLRFFVMMKHKSYEPYQKISLMNGRMKKKKPQEASSFAMNNKRYKGKKKKMSRLCLMLLYSLSHISQEVLWSRWKNDKLLSKHEVSLIESDDHNNSLWHFSHSICVSRIPRIILLCSDLCQE